MGRNPKEKRTPKEMRNPKEKRIPKEMRNPKDLNRNPKHLNRSPKIAGRQKIGNLKTVGHQKIGNLKTVGRQKIGSQMVLDQKISIRKDLTKAAIAALTLGIGLAAISGSKYIRID